MKEKNSGENTVKRKRFVYSLISAICILLLVAATVLTVYFVSTNNANVLENPSPEEPDDVPSGEVEDPSSGQPGEPEKPSSGDNEEPDAPTGGDTVAFVTPVAAGVCSVEYDSVYTNLTLNGQIRIHKAVDFAADEGAEVVAVSAGTVETISYSAELGNLIVIDHGDGLKSYYRFVEPVDGLKEGAQVGCGEQIATVAAAYGTEYKDGTHLHFQIELNGEWVDPAGYFDITYEEK